MIDANLHLGAELLDGLQSIGGGGFVNAGHIFPMIMGGPAPNSFMRQQIIVSADAGLLCARRRRSALQRFVLFDVYGPADRRGKPLPQLIFACAKPLAAVAIGH